MHIPLSVFNGDKELLDYIYENYDELECELNGNECKELKKRNHNLCIGCNIELTTDYQKSTLVCTNCGLSQLNQVFVTSYNHDATIEKEMCIQKIPQFQSNSKTVLLWWKKDCSR